MVGRVYRRAVRCDVGIVMPGYRSRIMGVETSEHSSPPSSRPAQSLPGPDRRRRLSSVRRITHIRRNRSGGPSQGSHLGYRRRRQLRP
jgi:hypothetical protein